MKQNRYPQLACPHSLWGSEGVRSQGQRVFQAPRSWCTPAHLGVSGFQNPSTWILFGNRTSVSSKPRLCYKKRDVCGQSHIAERYPLSSHVTLGHIF